MLMSLETLAPKYGISCHEILHVGAHLGEEAEQYQRYAGDPMVIWVEANPEVIPKLRECLLPFPTHHIVNALVTDRKDDERPFHVTNYDGMSSSVFEFDRHPMFSPDTVFVNHLVLPTTTIDDICEHLNFWPQMLCLDIQGAELLAFRGAHSALAGIQWVYTEVSIAPVYKGGAQMYEIDDYLGAFGFRRAETDLGMHGGTHGDALYVK